MTIEPDKRPERRKPIMIRYDEDPEQAILFIEDPENVQTLREYLCEYTDGHNIKLTELALGMRRRAVRWSHQDFEDYFPKEISVYNIKDFKSGASPLTIDRRLLVHVYLWVSCLSYRIYCRGYSSD